MKGSGCSFFQLYQREILQIGGGGVWVWEGEYVWFFIRCEKYGVRTLLEYMNSVH